MRPDPVDPDDPSPASPEEEVCAAALGDYTDLLNADAAPSIDLFLIQHPECPEAMLRPALEAVVYMSDLFNEVRRSKGGEALIDKMVEQAKARAKRKRERRK
ncbi:MAG: hypothetical protein FD180_239 [Planctomycetota bacterium]|nr:MAG: hypothetical protein FD180_239 [Planctomycetota bacterium]